MDIYFYLLPGVFIMAFAAVWYLTYIKRANKKKIPEICMGAIRVTDRSGRDMVIVRKDDGTFEMMEEEKIRKQCVP